MAIKDYSLTELKELVLLQINKIKGLDIPFDSIDSDEAYDSAVRECGFELPETDDVDKAPKYRWLAHRMGSWYFSKLLERNIYKFKMGDLEANQLVGNLERLIKKYDEEFTKAKEDAGTTHLFMDADTAFGEDMIVAPGFIEDRVGESIEERT